MTSSTPVPTGLVQKVQLRVYLQVAPGRLSVAHDLGRSLLARQRPFEIVMRRRALLAGKDGGFQAVMPEEREYQLLARQMGPTEDAELRGPVVLHTCGRCHEPEGILSVDSYFKIFARERPANPRLWPVSRLPGDRADRATVAWKEQQSDWGMLRRLLTTQGPTVAPP